MLFFGRRQQTTDLLDRLNRSRFLAVVGSSACGKSSLVLAGLLPQLEAGFLVDSRDGWMVVHLTPGDRPLERLAAGLGTTPSELREAGAHLIAATLKAHPENAERNFLILVDQFEELFRFALSRGNEDEAAEFVRILLDVVEQREFPVFVATTMRSDFLGDCDQFRGLPEALNRSQYLVPRLTRQQLRESIEGPTRLFGAGVEPRLMDRVLNEVGDDPDTLAVLQLAMMRTWEHWARSRATRRLDVPDYTAIGGVKDCVPNDAESAMTGMDATEQKLTERIFQALTDTDYSNRRVRRPARLDELERLTGAPRETILSLIERFCAGGRSFLRLDNGPNHLIDISHEALIRKWDRLWGWVDAEALSKRVYLDLVDAVSRRKALLHEADLQAALDWRARVKPTHNWAERYAGDFERAMAFLDESEAARNREQKEQRQREQEMVKARRFKWLLIGAVAAVLAFAAVAWRAYASGRSAVVYAALVWRQKAATDQALKQAEAARKLAESEGARAENALEISRKSMQIRQAALSGDLSALESLTKSIEGPTSIHFKATRSDLHYKNSKGQQIYTFEMFPDARTLPGGNDAVAFVTYLADHPTFRNTLMTAGPSRGFRVSYPGWGCLTRIVALIEFKDPSKAATTTVFDMCSRLEN